ncbi:DUF5995 family protein [Aquibacillus koreensis]|uniref:DUF5995 family protein n=1 Tax=Aquibacillus koreensis TaxID=279446 RepID=A0A9X3WJY3_9BACI|nr:DUF5995 family protein [Aquibacillus koreensis]MCT2535226.1 DUF5995 family protein [Aquibacillus koreensis]MDC3421085.1 DUF5995 family protein [Aquibacillus koreensis]
MSSISKELLDFQSLDQVIEDMTRQLKELEEAGDYRAIFQRVYLLMTKEMKKRLTAGFFHDDVWMERVLVRFAQYYFDAIQAHEQGEPYPLAWELAFRMAKQQKVFVLQDALLGINAHINSDLPIVMYVILSEDKVWPDASMMLNRRQDHEKINDVLSDLVDLVQNELASHYARSIRIIDRFMGRKDESLSSFVLAHCRTNVWYNTELMLNAQDEEERILHQKRIENDAYVIGLQIAQSDSRFFRFLRRFAPFTRKRRWF